MNNTHFQRTQLTWFCYALLAFHAILQALLSTQMPFIRSEFDLDYTQTGLFMSANALGMVLAGLSAGRLSALIGRRTLLYISLGGAIIGLVLVGAGRVPEIPLAGAFLCGVSGPLCMFLSQAFLSDLHGNTKAVALSESSISAGIGSLSAPLLVSAVVASGLAWRGASWIMLFVSFLIGIVFWKISLPQPAVQPVDPEKRSRPRGLFLAMGVFYLSVSVEWCVIFWSADFLEKIAGFSKVSAAACISAFFAGIILGRFILSRLVRRFSPRNLLLLFQGIAALGVILFWLSPWSILRVAGLLISSLGIANLGPLGMIEIFNRCGDTNTAGARATLTAGLAILTAPLFLGGLADVISIQKGYGAVLILLILGVLLSQSTRVRARVELEL